MPELTKSQLATILSALDGEPRNPNSKETALTKLCDHAADLGRTLGEVFEAAQPLLDGTIDAEAFLAKLREPIQETEAEAAQEVPDLDVAIEPDVAAAKEPRISVREQLIAACRLAGTFIITREGDQAEVITKLRAAIERATKAPKPRREPRDPKGEPREGTKESRAIEMLRQPEGATVAQLMAEMNWLKQSTHGFFANLKRKRGLSVTSEKPEDGERVYKLG